MLYVPKNHAVTYKTNGTPCSPRIIALSKCSGYSVLGVLRVPRCNWDSGVESLGRVLRVPGYSSTVSEQAIELCNKHTLRTHICSLTVLPNNLNYGVLLRLVSCLRQHLSSFELLSFAQSSQIQIHALALGYKLIKINDRH
jgi:hypothetical protein